MSKLLSHRWTNDVHDIPVLCIEKGRGKISISELQQYLLYEARIENNWFITFTTHEGAGEVGWPEEEPKGDKIFLYPYSGDDTCPICASILPPEFCPQCG